LAASALHPAPAQRTRHLSGPVSIEPFLFTHDSRTDYSRVERWLLR
jgi:hypothetical protein